MCRVVVLGVNAYGYREAMGVMEDAKEDKDRWAAFQLWLHAGGELLYQRRAGRDARRGAAAALGSDQMGRAATWIRTVGPSRHFTVSVRRPVDAVPLWGPYTFPFPRAVRTGS